MPPVSNRPLSDFATQAVLAADDKDGAPATPMQTCGAPPPEAPIDPTKTWIEITLVDTTGLPVAYEAYAVRTPTGEVMEGSLDEDGFARLEGVDPGQCEVAFPNIDAQLWRRQGA